METKESTQPISIMCYNIWFNNLLIMERATLLISTILELKPDIICLQEVTPRVLVYLVEALQKEYPFISNSLAKKSYGEAIFSKYKFINTEYKEFTRSWMNRGILYVRIEVNNTKINIATTHLESEFKKVNAYKLLQYHEIFGYLDSQEGISLWCGDTNIAEEEDMQYIVPKGWLDPALDKFKDVCIPTYDCNTNVHVGLYSTRLDRIFIKESKNANITSLQVLNKKNSTKPKHISDHHGLMFTVAL